jgi:hypothetical protein
MNKNESFWHKNKIDVYLKFYYILKEDISLVIVLKPTTEQLNRCKFGHIYDNLYGDDPQARQRRNHHMAK